MAVPASPEDTIAAISTAPGEGGIGLIRLSGRAALAVADAVFRSPKGVAPSAQKPFTAQYGHVVEKSGPNERRVDEALILVMRAPKSYTREDMAEISCHGGRAVMQRVLGACLAAGARAAEPGEFTKRAFLNGRLDLAQAEAVLDLIRAKTDLAADASRRQLEGALSALVRKTRDDLALVLSHIEASLDFPDDRIEPMRREEMRLRLVSVSKDLEAINRHARSGIFLREGVRAVLAGRPNAGKSSLMNALLNKNRVIVSPRPGTTRDTVEEEIQIGGFAVRLVDTAGLQDSSCEIEREGIARSREAIEKADLVLFVTDASATVTVEDEAFWESIGSKGRVLVRNKIDLAGKGANELLGSRFADAFAMVHTSCTTGTGLETLSGEIARFAGSDAPPKSEEYWVTSVRHLELFRRAAGHVRDALAAYENNLSSEFPASDVRLAMDALGEIVGEVVTDDILELIFSQFCIGK